ncbi:MAG: 2-amino-4-hydroxy-6-hydroxymethyldihydropteridine diphosphokinase [Bacteroidales bacterium]|nr:2-amino-4-hydroxy-6-hydroxymethyldihydropteridine diphosphokinase [Bacteroidales bacterium]MDZ4205097.1 2-amino-4-hydroxy-6-hydroxymethyldihydropteridine diphosphokinase [Bacteroidales bacterium]
MIHKVYLITGSNRGNRLQMLQKAARMIIQRCGEIVQSSKVYMTQPWGFHDDTPFLNQVLLLETGLNPFDLLEAVLQIESDIGRIRNADGYTSRKIDIDILFFDNRSIEKDILKIPHPHIAERRFVLTPLAEIAPELVHPHYSATIYELLQQCTDELEVRLYPNKQLQTTSLST